MLSAEVDNMLQDLNNSHPRRSNGSPSGREKRRDESFQVRAKDPLSILSPNYFQKFKQMAAPDWAQKMRCIIVPNRRTVSFREFVHDGYCLATLARFVHQACASKGNFYFYFPNQKRRNYRWVEKTFGMLSAGAIQFAPRIFCLWLITMYRK